MVTGASSGGGFSSLCFSFQCLFKLFRHLYKLPHNEQANFTGSERERRSDGQWRETSSLCRTLTSTGIVGIGNATISSRINRNVIRTFAIGKKRWAGLFRMRMRWSDREIEFLIQISRRILSWRRKRKREKRLGIGRKSHGISFSLSLSLSGARAFYKHPIIITMPELLIFRAGVSMEAEKLLRIISPFEKKAKQDQSDASIRQEMRVSVQVQTKRIHLPSIHLSDHRTFTNSLHTSIRNFTSLAALVRRYLLFKTTYRSTIENGSTLVESLATQICFSPLSSSNIISECSSNAKIELHAWAQVLIFFFVFSA